ncbi:uncharacterized protein LOC116218696 isoform X2 [Clupea harengus]|nr:uncharacterized protein LOC116218696 isoform X2 [Clupea harengus]
MDRGNELGPRRNLKTKTSSVNLSGREVDLVCEAVTDSDSDSDPLGRHNRSKKKGLEMERPRCHPDNSFALARERLISLKESISGDECVYTEKIRQQYAEIKKVEEIINDQRKKIAAVRQGIEQVRFRNSEERMQELQNSSRPDNAEVKDSQGHKTPPQTKREHQAALGMMEAHLDKMEGVLLGHKKRLDEMRLEKRRDFLNKQQKWRQRMLAMQAEKYYPKPEEG